MRIGGRWNACGGRGAAMILNSFERMGSELFQHGNTDTNYIKYEDIPVEAISENVPSHINTFDDDEF